MVPYAAPVTDDIPHLRNAADEAGFSLLGVTPAVRPDGLDRLVRWVEAGYGGSMDYIADRIDAYEHPRAVLQGVRSIIALAYPYCASAEHPVGGPDHGKVARYAWSGVDYHDVIHDHFKRRLLPALRTDVPDARIRGVVDTAPLMERDVARAAGLGWIGKNTLLLHPKLGSYFFLAAVLTDADLTPTPRPDFPSCGTCRACLDACPTDAFPRPGVLDATRCISYHTIESRDPIPDELAADFGDWVFGCDVCQEVCPFNHWRARSETATPDAMTSIDCRQMRDITDEDFRDRYRRTPLWRSRREGIRRNAENVLRNRTANFKSDKGQHPHEGEPRRGDRL